MHNILSLMGQTERLNQIIKDMLRAYVAKTPSKWEQYLKRVGSSAYHLVLPRNVGIHLVFHVSRLKPFLDSGDNSITIQDLVT